MGRQLLPSAGTHEKTLRLNRCYRPIAYYSLIEDMNSSSLYLYPTQFHFIRKYDMLLLRPLVIGMGILSLTGASPTGAGRKMLPAPSDPVIRMDSPSCVIPFIRAGNLILIKAKVDTVEGNFILDTGAPDLVLNMTYFRHYPSRNTEGDEGGITGAVRGQQGTTVEKFSLGPIGYYHVEADRIDLGHIENNKGIKILGLLGMQLFTRFEMIIDYEKQVIYLHLIGNKEATVYRSDLLKDGTAYHEFPIDLTDYKIIVHTEMAGKKLLFLVDFGAESNVLDSRLSNKIFENVTVTRRVLLSGSGTKKVEALYGSLKNLKIGGRDLGELPVLITNLENMCSSYNHCLDGMLGFDFLSLHKIGFNFVRHKMYIWN
jgi:Aspartyl protease